MEAENRKDEEALSYMSDDIILHIADMPPFQSKEALRQPFTEYSENQLVSREKRSTRIEIAACGDMAYDVGTSTAVVKGKQESREVHQKYLDIWRKEDGDWRCVASSWSNNTP